jgi:hypothetical protein
MKKPEPKRKIQLNPTACERLYAEIDSGEAEALASILAATIAKLRLRRLKAWEEIARIAELDDDTETCRVSMTTCEILVYEKGPTIHDN